MSIPANLDGAVTADEQRGPLKKRKVQLPVRLAFIGCGAIAEQMHLPVLAGDARFKLSALVDRDRRRASRLAAGYNVPLVLNDAGELDADKIDAAIVATPAYHHASCSMELLRKGIHVLVEKPMATSYSDAELMVSEAERSGAILSVGFFRRLNPSFRLLQGLLDSEWAGRPLRFLVEGGGMYSWAAATLGNMRRDLAGGGALIDFGSHMVDLMFALFDEPAEILEYQHNAREGIEADCSIRLRVLHRGEPIEGRIELARTRCVGNFIRVECEQATLEFQVNERFQISVIPRGSKLTDPVHGHLRDFVFRGAWRDEALDESWYATFARQFDDWVDAMTTGKAPLLSGQSALPTSRLIQNCYDRPQRMEEPWVETWSTQINGRESKTEESLARGGSRGLKQSRRHRVLVTGASGFIGCRLAEILTLRDNCEVRALVHNPGNASRLARLNVEMVQADLAVATDVRQLVDGCDAIVHCAVGTSWGEEQKNAQVTLHSTHRLAEAARKLGLRRFVHVSTMSVYGDDHSLKGSLNEQTPVSPSRANSYGATKAAAEQCILKHASRGLSAVIFRPAHVYGPFSRIFITRPIQAIASNSFGWLGSPDVACDMVYVDNVVEALISGLFADSEKVTGQLFNIGDEDTSTWRDFYSYFARELDLDLSNVPIREPNADGSSRLRTVLMWPGTCLRGVGQLVRSAEFKLFGHRVLDSDPIGTLPRKALARYPFLERSVRRLVGAEDTLPIYERKAATPSVQCEMGSGGSVLNIEKLRRSLNFQAPVTPQRARELTLKWIRHARLV